MIIANDLGPVDHAWLDAGLIDDSCAGLRCRLVVGGHGGIVCDVVTGSPARGIPEDALPRVAATVATHAVVNTDPRSVDPLPLTDGSGRPARILADAADGRDTAVPDRMTVATAVNVESTPRSHLRTFTQKAVAHGVLTIAALACAVATSARQDASTGIMLFIAGVLASGAVKWFRRAKAEKAAHPERIVRYAASMRELERRARLPDTIS